MTWTEVFDRLQLWYDHPETTKDAGVDATDPLAAERALWFAHSMGSLDPPTSVVPDGSGGISFEWYEGKTLRVNINFWSD